MSGYNVAVVGATGLVGERIISILEDRSFPVENIFPLASSRSVGSEISFCQEQIAVKELKSFDFKGIDFCFFSAGANLGEALFLGNIGLQSEVENNILNKEGLRFNDE